MLSELELKDIDAEIKKGRPVAYDDESYVDLNVRWHKYADVIEAKLNHLAQNGGWISVETRKPDYGEEVLVYYGDGYMRLNTLFDDEPDFTYWKPIQPPLIEHPSSPLPDCKTE